MTGILIRRSVLGTLAVLGCLAGNAVAADLYKKDTVPEEAVALPKLADVQDLAVYPEKIQLKGGDDAQQLIVTATLAAGRFQDLSGDVKYEIGDGKIVRVTSAGRVSPLANGQTQIIASYGDKKVIIPVNVVSIGVNLPINFGNQIVPVFTKLGCNSGGCHGKASGQNGFKLSLLGFDPEVDYAALTREGRGRRVLPAAPDGSLLLRKPTGVVAHGGGKRLDPSSSDFRLLRRWIRSGMPFGNASDARV